MNDTFESSTEDAPWPKPWRLKWWRSDPMIYGGPRVEYYDTKEEAEKNAPLAPWEVKHESEVRQAVKTRVESSTKATLHDLGGVTVVEIAQYGHPANGVFRAVVESHKTRERYEFRFSEKEWWGKDA